MSDQTDQTTAAAPAAPAVPPVRDRDLRPGHQHPAMYVREAPYVALLAHLLNVPVPAEPVLPAGYSEDAVRAEMGTEASPPRRDEVTALLEAMDAGLLAGVRSEDQARMAAMFRSVARTGSVPMDGAGRVVDEARQQAVVAETAEAHERAATQAGHLSVHGFFVACELADTLARMAGGLACALARAAIRGTTAQQLYLLAYSNAEGGPFEDLVQAAERKWRLAQGLSRLESMLGDATQLDPFIGAAGGQVQ